MGDVTTRWVIRLAACLALCGCQAEGFGASDDSCPNLDPCGEFDPEARLSPAPGADGRLAQADVRPSIPGCPWTLQVMTKPIVYRAVRPTTLPERSDPASLGDDDCSPPEAPLMRAERRGEPLAAR